MANTIITGEKELTFTVGVMETVEIEYGYNPLVNIANLSAGDIYINGTGDFTGGEYITLPAGSAYDRFRAIAGGSNEAATVYIKASAAGKISVAVAVY